MGYDGISDFRSDTVTRPTPAMYEAMRTAPLGDDVYGDDPTVNQLEAYAAELFGKQAALLVPSGTMANQIAARVLTERGDEVLIEAGSHAFFYEQAALAQLSGLQCRTVAGDRGRMDLAELASMVREDDVHFPTTRLVVLENTHNRSGGAVLPVDYLRAVRELADRFGLRLHVDGARICNAAVAAGESLDALAAGADTVSCCLSKGLGAPVGSVLAGGKDVIARARRARKLFGGGMRQAGILAAAGLVALRDMRDRLADDHRRAAALADGLRARGLTPLEPETNIVFVDAPGRSAEVVRRFAEHGVLASGFGPDTVRFVTHNDIDDADVERALAVPVD